MIIRSIGVLSAGKVLACLGAMFGFLGGCLISLITIIDANLLRPHNQLELLIFGFGAVVVLPLINGFMGFFGGVIGAAVYNLIASVVGGLEIELTRSFDDRRFPE